jgi:RNA 2',3'-cyclic 3'-phosphodiesterase
LAERGKSRPGSPRARLFLALDLPEPFRSDLALWRDEAIRGRDDLRPVASEALHVTLVFLGYRPEKEIETIADTAFEAVRSLPPPRLSAGEVKPIPPRGPRLFALDLNDPDGAAVTLQAAASDALASARFYKPEKRPFWPHVTFTRVKRNQRAGPLEAPPPPPDPFVASEVTLYRSLLSPKGAVYEPLARATLTS